MHRIGNVQEPMGPVIAEFPDVFSAGERTFLNDLIFAWDSATNLGDVANILNRIDIVYGHDKRRPLILELVCTVTVGKVYTL